MEVQPDGAAVDEALMTDESDGDDCKVEGDDPELIPIDAIVPVQPGAEPRDAIVPVQPGAEPMDAIVPVQPGAEPRDACAASNVANDMDQDEVSVHVETARTVIEKQLDHERNSIIAALTAVKTLGGCDVVENAQRTIRLARPTRVRYDFRTSGARARHATRETRGGVGTSRKGHEARRRAETNAMPPRD